MRSSLIRFAIAGLAALALATSADAETIFSFGATNNPNDVKTLTRSGSTTTIATSGTTISITDIGNVAFAGVPGTEIFTNVSSTAPVTGSGGVLTQDSFTGTIQFLLGTGAATTPVLTATLTQATPGLLTVNGSTGSFTANNVVLTNLNPLIMAQNGGATTILGNITISLLFPSPQTGTNLTTTTSVNTGSVNSVIPEPAGIVSGSIALLAGLGCFGWSRSRVSKV